MVRRCIGCDHQDEKKRLFSFPTDEGQRQEWANAMGIGLTKVNTQMKVCERHFRESDFKNSSKKTLRQNALPNMNMG